jgi:hypothetical protein
MNRNRALEFLNEAHGMVDWYQHRLTTKTMIRLAITEVQELLDRIAELEARPTATAITATGGPVLIVDAQPMTPARLTDRQRERAALPGNGRKL